MKKGTLSEHYLENAVLKNIKRIDKDFSLPKVGSDFSIIDNIVTSEGTGELPYIAFFKAYNNFLCSGGIALGFRLSLFLPVDTKESKIKQYMSQFEDLSLEYNIQLLGGNTFVSDSLRSAQLTVTMVGKKDRFMNNKKAVNANCDIVMIGFAGTLGTNLLIEKQFEYLSEKLPVPYINSGKFSPDSASVHKAVSLLMESEIDLYKDIYYMHDISTGGVYSALWQLGKWIDKGIFIDNRKIPVKQETIEICEQLDINPYLLDGTGALLMVCNNSENIVRNLLNKGIEAAIIGHVTDSKERLVKLSPTDIRTLSPGESDEMYRV